MATLFTTGNFAQAYVDIVKEVYDMGSPRSPRGMLTRELTDVMICLSDVTRNTLPLGTGRGINTKIAAAEAIQLIGGFSSPELCVNSSPNFEHFRESDGTFWGAYGERISDQLACVVSKLRADPSSRQAVITLWKPAFDNVPGKKDYPCTIGLVYAIIDGKLCAKTMMRSNDVWLGLPYDVFQFTQLQQTIARVLEIQAGTYTHVALSLHLYEKHFAKVDDLHVPLHDVWLPSGISCSLADTDAVYHTACAVYSCTRRNTPMMFADENEQWYFDHLPKGY